MAELKSVTVNWDDQDRPVITVTYADSSAEGSAASMQADADTWLRAVAERVSDNGARLLLAVLNATEQREFVSFADLAADLGVEKKVLDGWNRNLGRSVKAVVRDHGFLRTDAEDGTAQLFDYQWDQPNNQWLYTVPTRYRPALKKALDER